MTRQATKKSTKATKKSVKSTAVAKEIQTSKSVEVKPTSKEITRMVVEVPSESVRSFKILCDLLGTTQGNLVAKALDKYVADNQEVVNQFISLRTQVI